MRVQYIKASQHSWRHAPHPVETQLLSTTFANCRANNAEFTIYMDVLYRFTESGVWSNKHALQKVSQKLLRPFKHNRAERGKNKEKTMVINKTDGATTRTRAYEKLTDEMIDYRTAGEKILRYCEEMKLTEKHVDETWRCDHVCWRRWL